MVNDEFPNRRLFQNSQTNLIQKKPKKYLLFIIIGIIVMAIAVISIFYFTSGSRSDSSLEGVSSSVETRESKLKGSSHPSDTESNERGWNEEKYIWTFPEESQERLEDAYQLKLHRANDPGNTDAKYYSILNCIDYLVSSALENLSPPSDEVIEEIGLSGLIDSNFDIVSDHHSRRLNEEICWPIYDKEIFSLLEENPSAFWEKYGNEMELCSKVKTDEYFLPPEFNETLFEEYLDKTKDSSESCINQPVPEKYKSEEKVVLSALYIESEKNKEYWKSFTEAYSWGEEKSPLCGNGVLDEGEMCDYTATDEINNPYGDQCLVLCRVDWTSDGWEGCWGSGVAVCTDHPKVTDQYFIDNPKCIQNSNCVKFLRCNNVICPEPQ